MAKFTKLTIGDSVASSGGRVWKKLSAESATEEVVIISFTIAGTSYQAEEGMTWAEWVADTTYNTDGYILNNTNTVLDSTSTYDVRSNVIQYGNLEIVANTAYYHGTYGSSGGSG